MTNLESLLKRVGARIPASVTPATRIEIHPSEWIALTNEIERLTRYSLIVESYLDRETLQDVFKRWRDSPDGSVHEPGNND